MFQIKYKAQTPDERAMGLRGKPKLNPGEAMLFIYHSPQLVSFWNRGVSYDIDLGFFNKDGILIQKESLDADPMTDSPKMMPQVFSNSGVAEVIEVNKGELNKYPLGTHKDKMYMS